MQATFSGLPKRAVQGARLICGAAGLALLVSVPQAGAQQAPETSPKPRASVVAGPPTATSATPGGTVRQASIEQAFLLALGALDSGDPNTAIPIFRGILALDPTLVRVRLELARAYFSAAQWQSAREEFLVVLSGDLPVGVRRTVLQFIREIDARQGVEWDLSVSVVGVGNQREFDTDLIELDLGSGPLPFRLLRTQDTDTGLRIDGRLRLTRDLDTTPARSVAYLTEGFAEITEARNSTFDDYTLGVRTGLAFSYPQASWQWTPVIRNRWVGGEHFEDTYAVETVYERRTLAGLSIFATGSVAKKDNKFQANLDGGSNAAQIGAQRSIGGRAAIGGALFYDRNIVASIVQDTRTRGIRLFGQVDVGRGFTLRPELRLATKTFENPATLFTASPDEREQTLSLQIDKNDVFVAGRFSPFLRLTHTDVSSDIAAFSYEEQTIELGFRRNF